MLEIDNRIKQVRVTIQSILEFLKSNTNFCREYPNAKIVKSLHIDYDTRSLVLTIRDDNFHVVSDGEIIPDLYIEFYNHLDRIERRILANSYYVFGREETCKVNEILNYIKSDIEQYKRENKI